MPNENKEIERKFLVNAPMWHKSLLKKQAHRISIKQGYLTSNAHPTVRVRIKGNKGFITIKGKSSGLVRSEFEYEIPQEDAQSMLDEFCPTHISKIRHTFEFKGYLWEIDEFCGDQSPLIVAEVELQDPTVHPPQPPFIMKEVSDDFRYANSYLSQNPYNTWST